MVLDVADHSTRRVTNADRVIESDAVWMSDESFLFTQRDLGERHALQAMLAGKGEVGAAHKVGTSKEEGGKRVGY